MPPRPVLLQMNKHTSIRLAAALSVLLSGPALSLADTSPAALFGDDTIVYAETQPLAAMMERWSENEAWDLAQNEDYVAFARRMFGSIGMPLPRDLDPDIR